MELKFVIPNMEKTFGNLEFAGEDKVEQRRINGQLTVLSRSYNLYSDVQRADDIVVVLPAEAGDLVFFHSTYNAGSYITHVGIYLGNNRMFHAGDPIGYADLTSPYWQQHLVGAGLIKQ